MDDLTTLTNAELEARNNQLWEQRQALKAQQLAIQAELDRRALVAGGVPDQVRALLAKVTTPEARAQVLHALGIDSSADVGKPGAR